MTGEIMDTEILNVGLLQDAILQEIETYRDKLQLNNKATANQLKPLINSLLSERELILDELDEIKDIFLAPVPLIFRKDHQTKLVLSEVDEGIYNDFVALSNRLALPVGMILSSLMKTLIEGEKNSINEVPHRSLKQLLRRQAKVSISHHHYLEVSQNDLMQLDEKISFSHINYLKFSCDIDVGTFMKKVKTISHCQYVNVPENFPKLLVYAKLYGCVAVKFAFSSITSSEFP